MKRNKNDFSIKITTENRIKQVYPKVYTYLKSALNKARNNNNYLNQVVYYSSKYKFDSLVNWRKIVFNNIHFTSLD